MSLWSSLLTICQSTKGAICLSDNLRITTWSTRFQHMLLHSLNKCHQVTLIFDPDLWNLIRYGVLYVVSMIRVWSISIFYVFRYHISKHLEAFNYTRPQLLISKTWSDVEICLYVVSLVQVWSISFQPVMRYLCESI